VTAPTISVCVPTYNGSAYLAETLASISAQTSDDLEILIVDDGSSDDTLGIAERFATTERRARVVRKRRTGRIEREEREQMPRPRARRVDQVPLSGRSDGADLPLAHA
jgi:GT2 family glycosyltransferase